MMELRSLDPLERTDRSTYHVGGYEGAPESSDEVVVAKQIRRVQDGDTPSIWKSEDGGWIEDQLIYPVHALLPGQRTYAAQDSPDVSPMAATLSLLATPYYGTLMEG
jgi:hypothetical protein